MLSGYALRLSRETICVKYCANNFDQESTTWVSIYHHATTDDGNDGDNDDIDIPRGSWGHLIILPF